MKVAIVDGSAVVLRSITRMLSALKGVEIVGEAKSVPQAIDLIVTIKPVVVILDIRLQEGSGFDVLEHIKEEKIPSLVIMLTNYSSEGFRQRSQREGADFFFDKSSEFEKIIDVMEERFNGVRE